MSALEGYVFTNPVSPRRLTKHTGVFGSFCFSGAIYREKNGKWKYEVSFLLTFPRMNTREGQASNLLLETVNAKSLESPSELQIEDQIITSRKKHKKKKSEDLATGEE